MALGQLAYFGLAQVSHGKDRAFELGERQSGQKVGLILALVATAQERGPAAPVPSQARVVAGGHALDAEAPGPVEEQAELHALVAQQTGAGRAAGRVLLPRGQQHQGFEILHAVEHIVGKPEVSRHLAGARDAVDAATRTAAVGVVALLQLEGHADERMLFLLEQSRGHAAVHAPAHGDRDALAHGRAPRRNVTAWSTRATARSISSRVVSRPKENRTDERASASD